MPWDVVCENLQYDLWGHAKQLGERFGLDSKMDGEKEDSGRERL